MVIIVRAVHLLILSLSGSLNLLFCAGFVRSYFFLSFYPINMEFRQHIHRVVKYTAMTFFYVIQHVLPDLSRISWITAALQMQRQYLLTCKVSQYCLLACTAVGL